MVICLIDFWLSDANFWKIMDQFSRKLSRVCIAVIRCNSMYETLSSKYIKYAHFEKRQIELFRRVVSAVINEFYVGFPYNFYLELFVWSILLV